MNFNLIHSLIDSKDFPITKPEHELNKPRISYWKTRSIDWQPAAISEEAAKYRSTSPVVLTSCASGMGDEYRKGYPALENLSHASSYCTDFYRTNKVGHISNRYAGIDDIVAFASIRDMRVF